MNITMLGRMAQDTRRAEKHVEPCGDLISKQFGLRKLVTLVDILESIQKQTSLEALSSSFPTQSSDNVRINILKCPTVKQGESFHHREQLMEKIFRKVETIYQNIFFSTFLFLWNIQDLFDSPMATLDGTLYCCETRIALIGLQEQIKLFEFFDDMVLFILSQQHLIRKNQISIFGVFKGYGKLIISELKTCRNLTFKKYINKYSSI